jgi:hypothetical protein
MIRDEEGILDAIERHAMDITAPEGQGSPWIVACEWARPAIEAEGPTLRAAVRRLVQILNTRERRAN